MATSNNDVKRLGITHDFTPEMVTELLKCEMDPIYFIENYVYVVHPTKGKVLMKLYEYQKRMVRAIHQNKETILLCSRQMGKTTVAGVYTLWFTIFNEVKTAVIASKAMAHATEIMSRIKFGYENLPHWLKPGCKYYSRTSIEFENNSIIKTEATSEKTGRGGSPALLFIDELAFVSRRIQDELWASLAPSLSTGGKLIISSTPNGDQELFASLWRGAVFKKNPFFAIKVLWNEHPDRDQDYYDKMVQRIGRVKVAQELDCEFISSEPLLINSLILTALQQKVKPPLYTDRGIDWWKLPEEIGGREKKYLVGIDLSTGRGEDFSVIEIFEFPSLEQVGEYKTDTTEVNVFYKQIKTILKFLSRPIAHKNNKAEVYWSFERNSIGEAIISNIRNDESADGGVYLENVTLISETDEKMGFYTSKKSKPLTCVHLKTLIERAKRGFKINSDHLVAELQNFVAHGESFKAKTDATDDAIMASGIIVRILNALTSYEEEAREILYGDYSEDETTEMQNDLVDEDDEDGAPDTWGSVPAPMVF